MVVRTLRGIGIPEEAIRRALDRGDPQGAIFEAALLPGIARRTVSAEEIEAGGGLDAGEVLSLWAAFGLAPPEPGQAAFTPEEAEAFTEFARVRDVWPPELGIQLARVYGRHLSRIAQASVQLFRLYVERRLRAGIDDPGGELSAIRSAFGDLIPLADPFLVGVHRRWIEHALAQEAVEEAELESEALLPGSVEVAFLFCDLKDFTAYADREGDERATEAIRRFMDVVVAERGETFRFMKVLGDGAMLVYPGARDAVAAGQRIIAADRAPELPGVHASVHGGSAIFREGDYFGGAVNLAAKLLDLAGRDELVASEAAVDSCGEDFAWESAGSVEIRGVGRPVRVFLLSGPGDTPPGPTGRP